MIRTFPGSSQHALSPLQVHSVRGASSSSRWRTALKAAPPRHCFLLHVSGDFLRCLWTVSVYVLALVKHKGDPGSGLGRSRRSGSLHRSRDASVRPPYGNLRYEGWQLFDICVSGWPQEPAIYVPLLEMGPNTCRTSSKVTRYDIFFPSDGLSKSAGRPSVPAETSTSQVQAARSSLHVIAVRAVGEPSRPSQPLSASLRDLSP